MPKLIRAHPGTLAFSHAGPENCSCGLSVKLSVKLSFILSFKLPFRLSFRLSFNLSNGLSYRLSYRMPCGFNIKSPPYDYRD